MNTRHPHVTRRDFMRGTSGSTLGLTALTADDHAAANRSSMVILVRDEKALGENNRVNPEIMKAMMEKIVTTVTGQKKITDAWLSLVKPADRVGLVPTPHLNPTHKELVEAIRTSLIEAGIPAGHIVDAQGGPDKAKSCTALISLPALKAHWLTGIGTVLKNYITFSGAPSSYHEANNIKLGEIWNMPQVKGKTKLILVDALRPLCDKGPQPDPRYLWNYNGLLAGIDPVAVETVCLKIITEKRQALRGEPWPLSPPPLCVAAAEDTYKLGTGKWAEIKVEKIGWQQDSYV